MLSRSALSICVLVLPVGMTPAEDRKARDKLPGSATWELKAFDTLFRVVDTSYDAERMQLRWTVRTRSGHRTADFIRSIDRDRPFTFTFYDDANKELSVVTLSAEDFRGIPRERVLREGAQLEVVLAVPRAMPKVKKVVLQRGGR